jgi:lysophospholipase L1-like esterase
MKVFVKISLAVLCALQLLFSQDWANLKRFQQENLNLTASESGVSRVVLLGNSITEGWPKFYPEFFTNSSYIARGISGQTTPQMLLRFRQDVIDLHPDVVVILAGTNDIAGNTGPMTLDEIFGYIVSMCELALSNDIEIILSSVLPAQKYPWKKEIYPADQIVALNKMLREYARGEGIIYLDYFTHMADSKNGLKQIYTYDGVHPNREGYVKMSELLKQALEKVYQRS